MIFSRNIILVLEHVFLSAKDLLLLDGWQRIIDELWKMLYVFRKWQIVYDMIFRRKNLLANYHNLLINRCILSNISFFFSCFHSRNLNDFLLSFYFNGLRVESCFIYFFYSWFSNQQTSYQKRKLSCRRKTFITKFCVRRDFQWPIKPDGWDVVKTISFIHSLQQKKNFFFSTSLCQFCMTSSLSVLFRSADHYMGWHAPTTIKTEQKYQILLLKFFCSFLSLALCVFCIRW